MPALRARLNAGEHRYADLIRDAGGGPAFNSARHFFHFLADLADHVRGVHPIKSNPGGALLHFLRLLHGGQAGRDVVEHAWPGVRGLGASARSAAWIDSQASVWAAAVLDVTVAEHLGVPAHHLVADRGHHILEMKLAVLLGHAGVEHHLEQEIAEFVLEGGLCPCGRWRRRPRNASSMV